MLGSLEIKINKIVKIIFYSVNLSTDIVDSHEMKAKKFKHIYTMLINLILENYVKFN